MEGGKGRKAGGSREGEMRGRGREGSRAGRGKKEGSMEEEWVGSSGRGLGWRSATFRFFNLDTEHFWESYVIFSSFRGTFIVKYNFRCRC